MNVDGFLGNETSKPLMVEGPLLMRHASMPPTLTPYCNSKLLVQVSVNDQPHFQRKTKHTLTLSDSRRGNGLFLGSQRREKDVRHEHVTLVGRPHANW
jgi:hypothetical protein